MIDTYWSDHCRHTTFSTIIDHVNLRGRRRCRQPTSDYLAARKELGPQREAHQTLMDIATIGAKVPEDSGASCRSWTRARRSTPAPSRSTSPVDGEHQDWLLLFKNETHNHPTEIEPFGGAATCIGGAIRDPLSGRAYVYQAMRVTGAADPLTPVEETLPGKLPQRKIVTTAAAGYSSYGNQIGLATGHGGRDLPPRLRRQAHGDRRGGGRRPGGKCPPGAPRPGRRGHPAGRPHRPGRHAAAQPAPPRATT